VQLNQNRERHAAAFITTKGVDTSKRLIECIVSSETLDSHGDVIDQASWNLDRYQKNPVVLFGHDHAQPIGRTVSVAVRDGALHAVMELARTERAAEVLQLFADGALRAFSVGFRVGRVELVKPGDGSEHFRLSDCELFEISAVSVPSNPDALVKHKSLGLVPAGYQLGDAGDQLVELGLRAAGFDRSGGSITDIAARAVDRGGYDGPEAA
jgi:HK97 family phage prohead protease